MTATETTGDARPGGRLRRKAWIAVPVFAGLSWAFFAPPLHAQDSRGGSIPERNRGVQVRELSVFGVYYSTTLPNQGGFGSTSTGLGADMALGASTQVGYMRTGQRSSFSFLYAPTYIGRVRYSAWNALNHDLSLTGTRRFGRWDFAPSASGSVSNFEGFLFSPTVFSNVASASPSYSTLSAAMLGRGFHDAALNTALNGAAPGESMATLLYGERVLNLSARAAVSYSPSARLSLKINAGARRYQRIDTQEISTQRRRVIPTTTSGTAGLGISYAVSRNTQFGVTGTMIRVVSELYDSYNSTAVASIGRTLAGKWILEARGGVGVTNVVRRTTAGEPTGPRPVGGGSLGYRSYSHTLLASYDRTVNDSYGAGATTIRSSSGSWRWERRGSGWIVVADVSWQQLEGMSSRNTSVWRTSAGWGKALGAHVVLHADYAYLDYSGRLETALYRRSQSALRLSLAWRPQPALGR